MNENQAMVELYKEMAKIEADNSKRWHKQLIASNIIWAVVLVLIVVGLVIAHFVYESQFEVEETEVIERSTISQENDNGNNVYQPGEYATYNEGGD